MTLKNSEVKKAWELVKLGDSANTHCGYVADNTFYSLSQSACHGVFSRAQIYSAPDAHKIEELWSKKFPNNSPLGGSLEDIHYPWLLNDSPWAKAFIQKDYKICKKEGFSLRADLPHNYVASALVATRWLSERYSGYGSWTIKRQPLYKKLLDNNVEPLWAYVIANFYSPIDNSNTRWSFVMQSGHEHLPQTLTVESLRAFINGQYDSKSPTFRVNKGYDSIGSAWTYVGGKVFISTLARNWHSKNKEKVDHNIFRKPATADGMPVVDLDYLISLVQTLKDLVNGK